MNEFLPGVVELFEPRSYQIEAVDFAVRNNGRVIIHDGMGLGKTGEGLLIKKKLHTQGACLVICGKNAQYVWKWQAPHWNEEPPVVIEGKPYEREILWKRVSDGRLRFVTVTREVLKRDIKAGWVPQQWWMIIVDEAHRDINRKTAAQKSRGKDTKQQFMSNNEMLTWLAARHFLFMSGSKKLLLPQNLWALLRVLYPKQYTSYWRFVERYCHVTKNGFGGWEVIGPKDTQGLAFELRNILIRRTKEMVLKDLPPKTRDFSHRIDMTELQAKVTGQLVRDNLAELGPGELVVTPTVLARIVRMRQLLVCPRILDPSLEDGASVDHLVEMLDESDPHMVVFTPFTAAIPFVDLRLRKEGYNDIVHLQGGIYADELGKRIDQFRRTRGICICSVQFAEAFDLTPASWAYFLGPEWDPDVCEQAEDRLHRMNSTNPVWIYYPRYNGGVDDELMFDALDTKTRGQNRIIRSVQQLRERMQQMAKKIS